MSPVFFIALLHNVPPEKIEIIVIKFCNMKKKFFITIAALILTRFEFAQTEPAYGKNPKAGYRKFNETINDFFKTPYRVIAGMDRLN